MLLDFDHGGDSSGKTQRCPAQIVGSSSLKRPEALRLRARAVLFMGRLVSQAASSVPYCSTGTAVCGDYHQAHLDRPVAREPQPTLRIAWRTRKPRAGDVRPATPQRPQPSRYACAICMENEAIEAVVTACGHLYCWSCLYRWLDAGHSRCPVCSARVNKSDVTPLYASELRGRPPSPVPRPRSRTPSPVARSSPRQWDSPERTPPRSTSLPPPLPSLVDGRAANAAFPSLFGLQFRRLLWRRGARGQRTGAVVDGAAGRGAGARVCGGAGAPLFFGVDPAGPLASPHPPPGGRELANWRAVCFTTTRTVVAGMRVYSRLVVVGAPPLLVRRKCALAFRPANLAAGRRGSPELARGVLVKHCSISKFFGQQDDVVAGMQVYSRSWSVQVAVLALVFVA